MTKIVKTGVQIPISNFKFKAIKVVKPGSRSEFSNDRAKLLSPMLRPVGDHYNLYYSRLALSKIFKVSEYFLKKQITD